MTTLQPNIDTAVDNYLSVFSQWPIGIYHPFGSMLDAIESDSTLKGHENVIIADGSAMESVVGSPAAMIAANALKITSAFIA